MQGGNQDSRNILDVVLEDLPCLDQADQTIEIDGTFSLQGGCSDVYHGRLLAGGNVLPVAIKRIRVSLYEDQVFAKV